MAMMMIMLWWCLWEKHHGCGVDDHGGGGGGEDGGGCFVNDEQGPEVKFYAFGEIDGDDDQATEPCLVI